MNGLRVRAGLENLDVSKNLLSFCSLHFTVLTSVLVWPLALPARAQAPAEAGYAALSRGPDDRLWAKLEWHTNSAGVATATTNTSFVEVGTGLHFFRDGAWRESRDLVELAPDGKSALALYGPHKVQFSADLSSDTAITITTKSNRVFQTHPLGIYYFEPQSGRLVRVAAVNEFATAELLPPNQLLYRSAFDSDAVKADLRLTYTKAGLESDVIFTRKPKPPGAFGLDEATAQLQVHHAWLNAPVPRVKARVLSTGVVDETLDFGDLWFPLGRAFACDDSEKRDPSVPAEIHVLPEPGGKSGVPVGKHWRLTDGGDAVLIESVTWSSVAPELSRLPEMANAARPVEGGLLAGGGPSPSDSAPTGPARKTIVVAATAHLDSPGFILDWILVSGSVDYTFSAGVTYWVSVSGYFSGTLSFEPGCVVKSSSCLVTYGAIAGGGWPCTLTAWNDELYGDHIPGSDGCPTYFVSYGLVAYYFNEPAQILGFRIRWANAGLQIDGDYGGTVTDCQFEFCRWGVCSSSCQYGGITLDNVRICGVDYPLEPPDCMSGSATVICTGDSDSDGLPDVWEYQYFGDTSSQDGSENPDGDDLTNLQEYQAHSNPAVYRAATSGDQTVMTGVGQALNITLAGSSKCNEPITFTAQSGPGHGTLSGTGSTRTYTPSAGFQGWDSFTYTAGDSGAGVVQIYVVPGPILTTECRRNRIVLRWTIPQWVEGELNVTDFRVYRCAVTSGTCAPVPPPYQTISDPTARTYVDWGVVPNTVYCYKVTFRAALPGNYESPFSNTECKQVCPLPPGGPTDVAFIVDNSFSMAPALANLVSGIGDALDDIAAFSGGDYRLALVTPDTDLVDVRVPFTTDRGAFWSALNSCGCACGIGPPESTDECLNSVANALSAQGRLNSEGCEKDPLQIDDSSPFRTSPNVRKLTVLITDSPPGGFCDDYDEHLDPDRANGYAQQARANSIKINAIFVLSESETVQELAEPVMQDYANTTCGWFSEVSGNGSGIGEAVARMLYEAGQGNCP